MKALVLGASGATGSLLVPQLLERNVEVCLFVRPSAAVPEHLAGDRRVEIQRGNIDEIDPDHFGELLTDCDGALSCLGHNITFKGLFLKPRRLVVHAVERITRALAQRPAPGKFILMSTTAYTNRAAGEPQKPCERLLFGALWCLLPPHRDNMLAAEHLRRVAANGGMEWTAVRPDSLIDSVAVSPYDVLPMKNRSPLFNPGKTSRINVAHFMAELFTDEALWREWKFRAPVIYNRE
jgi:nucleoside-diphosphate-sugar epimerase